MDEVKLGRFITAAAKNSGRFAHYILGSQKPTAIGFVYMDLAVRRTNDGEARCLLIIPVSVTHATMTMIVADSATIC